jgi:1,3-beta-glucanosyltransferase GAS5
MKAYMTKQSNRQIPVGYSAADIVQNRFLLAEYLNCGDPSDAIDFYAFNSYEWCGNSSFTYFYQHRAQDCRLIEGNRDMTNL